MEYNMSLRLTGNIHFPQKHKDMVFGAHRMWNPFTCIHHSAVHIYHGHLLRIHLQHHSFHSKIINILIERRLCWLNQTWLLLLNACVYLWEPRLHNMAEMCFVIVASSSSLWGLYASFSKSFVN
jgi:hypothetical protein